MEVCRCPLAQMRPTPRAPGETRAGRADCLHVHGLPSQLPRAGPVGPDMPTLDSSFLPTWGTGWGGGDASGG